MRTETNKSLFLSKSDLLLFEMNMDKNRDTKGKVDKKLFNSKLLLTFP